MLIGILNLLDFRTKESLDLININEPINSRIFKFFKFYFIICIIIPSAFIIGLYIFTPLQLTALLTEILTTIGYEGVIIFYALLFFLTESLFNPKLIICILQIPMFIANPRFLRKERRRKRFVELKENFHDFLYGSIRISLKMALIITLINAFK
ncbi:hypothetical protein [Adhaeribacter radiodurans]|uniref:Uncharacterized protein n=1 Tax=Adhaeribacter radiodurans TaxID=2745197 RepID=A0A7L7L606_9BACT|nr:hypothetical protein [Adhaeribacter radiodurans]QMU27955.1 hypothetical protein HUW48_07805 [Adhaeribacter radiodurans]